MSNYHPNFFMPSPTDSPDKRIIQYDIDIDPKPVLYHKKEEIYSIPTKEYLTPKGNNNIKIQIENPPKSIEKNFQKPFLSPQSQNQELKEEKIKKTGNLYSPDIYNDNLNLLLGKTDQLQLELDQLKISKNSNHDIYEYNIPIINSQEKKYYNNNISYYSPEHGDNNVDRLLYETDKIQSELDKIKYRSNEEFQIPQTSYNDPRIEQSKLLTLELSKKGVPFSPVNSERVISLKNSEKKESPKRKIFDDLHLSNYGDPIKEPLKSEERKLPQNKLDDDNMDTSAKLNEFNNSFNNLENEERNLRKEFENVKNKFNLNKKNHIDKLKKINEGLKDLHSKTSNLLGKPAASSKNYIFC